jgi:AmmeMemoRadiSam system protein A
MELTLTDKKELLTIARSAIESALKDRVYKKPLPPKNKTLLIKAGAFVTLKKQNNLRGCIGYVEAHNPLFQTVADAAISAALKDYRFPSVRENELSEIEIEISVLTPPQPVKNTSEIVVGKDGLIMEKGFDRGLLLPQVPEEYGWNLEKFLEQTCLKAGLPPDAYQDPETKIWSFRAIVFNEKETQGGN